MAIDITNNQSTITINDSQGGVNITDTSGQTINITSPTPTTTLQTTGATQEITLATQGTQGVRGFRGIGYITIFTRSDINVQPATPAGGVWNFLSNILNLETINENLAVELHWYNDAGEHPSTSLSIWQSTALISDVGQNTLSNLNWSIPALAATGPAGPRPTFVNPLNVLTGAEGSAASATIDDTDISNVSMSFTIPRGNTGEQGIQGIQGIGVTNIEATNIPAQGEDTEVQFTTTDPVDGTEATTTLTIPSGVPGTTDFNLLANRPDLTGIQTNATNISTNTTNIQTNATSIITATNDRADIRTEFAAADATLTTDVDAIEAAYLKSASVDASTKTLTIVDQDDNDIVFTDVATDISALTTRVDDNETNIATNVTDIQTNATNIATNVTNIATNVTDIQTNATNIATNTTDIATNVTNIATNTTKLSGIEDGAQVNTVTSVNGNIGAVNLDTPAIIDNAGTPELATGIDEEEVRASIGINFGTEVGDVIQLIGTVAANGEMPVVDGQRLTNLSPLNIQALDSSNNDVNINSNEFGTLGGIDTSLTIQTQINSKQDTLSFTGNTTDYLKGDNTFAALDTLAVTENTNLYFTEARFDNEYDKRDTNTLEEGTDNSINETTPGAADGTNNLYYTDVRSREALSVEADKGITYNSATGVFSIEQDLRTTGDVTFNNISVAGDLTVLGTTTTVDVANLAVAENTISLSVSDPLITTQDAFDRGIVFNYGDGTAARIGFWGWDRSTDKFTYIPNAEETAVDSGVYQPITGTTIGSFNLSGTLSSELSDIPTIGTTGQILQVNTIGDALEYVDPAATPATTELTDISTTTAIDNQVLVYDNTDSEYKPETPYTWFQLLTQGSKTGTIGTTEARYTFTEYNFKGGTFFRVKGGTGVDRLDGFYTGTTSSTKGTILPSASREF